MSQAEELLEGIARMSTAGLGVKEEHIIIEKTRQVIVPESLRKIAVQFDHCVETVTFDCPRYWDEHDLSTMRVYIKYTRSDGLEGMRVAKNVRVNAYEDDIMHFDWLLTRNVTGASGPISFLVCIKKVDENGYEEVLWNSDLNNDMYVSDGLDIDETVKNSHPDIITQLLDRMDIVEDTAVVVTGEQIVNLHKRIDNLATLEAGSTTGDAELIDGRLDYTGKAWSNIGGHVRGVTEQLSENIAGVDDDLKGLTSYKKIGKNLYDETKIKEGFYIDSYGMEISNDPLFITDLIPIVSGEDYTISMTTGLGGYVCVSLFDAIGKFISNDYVDVGDFSIKNKRKYIVKRYDAAYIKVSTTIDFYKDNLMIEKASEPSEYERYYWYWDNATYDKLNDILSIADYSKYTLPYIKNGRVCCNGSGKTAYYAGIDCGSKVNTVWSNFIFEKGGTADGNATIIINPNGVDSISDITDLSLHCQIFPNRIKVDVLGNKFGEDKYYYQTLIDELLEQPLQCDGETEHTVILSVVEKTNNVYVTVDGVQYSGHFTITNRNEISSISSVIGRYVIFEHFCTSNRAACNMPEFTFIQARDVNNKYVLVDHFDRQDGVLQNAPTGQPYHLINNSNYKR